MGGLIFWMSTGTCLWVAGGWKGGRGVSEKVGSRGVINKSCKGETGGGMAVMGGQVVGVGARGQECGRCTVRCQASNMEGSTSTPPCSTLRRWATTNLLIEPDMPLSIVWSK